MKYRVVQCCAVQRVAIHFRAVQWFKCSVVQHSFVQNRTVWCNSVNFSMVQCSAVLCIEDIYNQAARERPLPSTETTAHKLFLLLFGCKEEWSPTVGTQMSCSY